MRRNYMLDIWTINVVAPTTEPDRYDRVALNPRPIVIIGREDVVRKILNEELKDYIKELVTNEEIWKETVYCGRRMRREDNCWEQDEFEWKGSDFTELQF